MINVQYLMCGDCSLLVKFGDSINEQISNKISQFEKNIKERNNIGIIETIPAYCTLMVCYKPQIISYSELVAFLNEIVINLVSSDVSEKIIIEIPVLYGNEEGPDIEYVANHNNIKVDDVIALHSEPEYYIYMLGFTPGFPYLGGMNKKIASPRLEKPRLKIEAGSVGIAGEQTGIYPISSPEGWQIIGQTPLELYNPDREEPILLRPGQYIKFKPIDKKEFDAIKASKKRGVPCSFVENKHYGIKKGFVVKSAGFFTTVQDLGRYKYQAFGVPVSGAMDQKSLKVANLLVDNEINESVLEVTMLGPTLEFTHENIIAITGGDLMPHINNLPISMNTAICCHKGDVLSFGGVKSGSRAYIAFAGGLELPNVMGSKSTYVKAGIGGLRGGKLEKNDEVGFKNPKTYIDGISNRSISIEDDYGDEIKLRVVLGPQDDCFTDEGINTFFNSTYTVTNEFDRMGCRLNGNIIKHKKDGNIISDGIAFGAIQVPSNGMPIIMLADRQTIGGYTKIANVISVDLPKLAQAKPGDKISFSNISIEKAQELYIEDIKQLENLKKKLEEVHNETMQGCNKYTIKTYNVAVNNKKYNVSIEEIH